MHGLVNKLVQSFIEDIYNPDMWDAVVRDSKFEFRDFEAMLVYDDDVTDLAIDGAARVLGKSRDMVLEDIGAYLVTHKNMEPVRRLLRFGGHTFEEFLYSLDDLPDRVTLAIPDLEMPTMEIREYTRHNHTLVCTWRKPGFGSVLLGMLRALGDDYGVLLMLEMSRIVDGKFARETIKIELLEIDFSEGREFHLAADGTG
ncbi:MAG: heme NO-binding domain-containing protein [Litoreibacter sp.]